MISTHILDLTSGNPADGVSVRLEKKSGNDWLLLKHEKTNSDGRIAFDIAPQQGVYQLRFEISEYQKKASFFIEAPVVFQITDTTRKYHIPLLLSAFGYSTYRGS